MAWLCVPLISNNVKAVYFASPYKYFWRDMLILSFYWASIEASVLRALLEYVWSAHWYPNPFGTQAFCLISVPVWIQASKAAQQKCPSLNVKVFSDRDIATRKPEIEKALSEADVFFGSLLFDYDQVLCYSINTCKSWDAVSTDEKQTYR